MAVRGTDAPKVIRSGRAGEGSTARARRIAGKASSTVRSVAAWVAWAGAGAGTGIGAGASVPISALFGKLGFRALGEAIGESARATAMIFALTALSVVVITFHLLMVVRGYKMISTVLITLNALLFVIVHN